MIEIRELDEQADFAALERIQRDVWQMGDLEAIPGRMMHTLHTQGAALYGAFAQEADQPEQMVGFNLGILATVEELTQRRDQIAAARLKMYSVMMGILPAYQRQGVGYRLKLAQRDFALRIGIRLITWTFDPLEAPNAHLNIGKLGAVCHRYRRHFHGDMGGVNAGLSTDRFDIEWWVTNNRVKGRVDRKRRPLSLAALINGGALLVNDVQFDERGFGLPADEIRPRQQNLLLVEIPHNFQAIKQQDFPLALRWREHGRTLFETLFGEGYLVTDFALEVPETGPRRCFYLLTRQSDARD